MTRRGPQASAGPSQPRPRGRRAPLLIASGASPLERARTASVVEALARAPGPVPASVVAVGSGADPDPARARGECGSLVRAKRQALLDGRADASAHPLGDLPGERGPGVVLGAVLPRVDAREALVAPGGRRLADLPAGARVGVRSAREAALLRAIRPDLATSEAGCDIGEGPGPGAKGRCDAMLVALADLALLGRAGEATQIFDAGEFVPAPAQGAIAIECRAGDARTLALLEALDHAPTRAATAAERAVLAAWGDDAAPPVGAHATVENGLVSLRAMLSDGADALPLVGDAVGPAADAARVGLDLGRQLREAARARRSAGGP